MIQHKPPTLRELRWFAGLLVPFGGLVGWLVGRRMDAAWLCLVCPLGLSPIAVLGLLRPVLIRPIYAGWMSVVTPVGQLVSTVLLTAIFVFVFTPVGLLLRACGYDAAKRKWEPGRPSYWIDRPEPPAEDRYFRQF